MALDFYSALDRLANPTQDMNGGDSAKALAQLMLQGGSMSMQGPDGTMQPIFNGAGAVPEAVKAGMSPSFKKVLEQADAMVQGVSGTRAGKPSIATPGAGNSMVQNPYGEGSFDPTNPAAVAAAQANAQAIGVPYTSPQQRMARGLPVGADPQSEAFYSTSKFEPSMERGSSLVANPYGPGSFDPSDPTSVEAVRKQGTQRQKVDAASQMIKQFLGEQPVTDPQTIMQEILGMAQNVAHRMELEKVAPQMAMQASLARQAAYNQKLQGASPIIKQILESVGIKDQEDVFGKAFAQARGSALGKASVGGGKKNIPDTVMRSLGADNFHDEISKGVANGSITPEQQIQLERLHQAKWDKTMVSDPDRRVITQVRTSVDALKRVQDAYKETPAYKTGKMGDTFKTALALSTSGAAFEQLAPFMQKLTPEERRYVAEANVFSLNLRNVSQDSRFSNFDSQKVIQAVGNPIVGKDLYSDQINAAVQELTNRHDNVIDDLSRQGRRVGEFKKIRSGTPAPKSGASSGWTVTVEK